MSKNPTEKYKYFEHTKTNDDGSTSKVIIAVTTYAGRTVKATASCIEGDTYCFEKGKELACARLKAKIAAKRWKRAQVSIQRTRNLLDAAHAAHDKAIKIYNNSVREVSSISEELSQLEKQMKVE